MAKIFLTHVPDMLENYYGERALAAMRKLGEVGLNTTGKVLDAKALAEAAKGCDAALRGLGQRFRVEHLAGGVEPHLAELAHRGQRTFTVIVLQHVGNVGQENLGHCLYFQKVENDIDDVLSARRDAFRRRKIAPEDGRE